ncbi:MAG: tetratricopeptide repeat protein [Candidatus Acidiferrales bacterium]
MTATTTAQQALETGLQLQRAGRFNEAITAIRKAIALQDDFAEAYNCLGNALHGSRHAGYSDEAISAYRRAIELRPAYPEAFNNLGNVLCEIGRYGDAIAAYAQALALRPSFAKAHSNLGNVFKDRGQLTEAIASYSRAVECKPDHALIGSNLAYAIHFHPDYDCDALSRELAKWNKAHGEPLAKLIEPHANDRSVDRKLLIGYVSPDFYAHAESYFVLPLLRNHDRQHFEIHCYSSARRPDSITAEIRKAADVWHDVLALSDEQLAEQIRADEIDVLIDLTMHMADNRLSTFARKPAPIAVSWLAYPGGTGLRAIDYRFTDAWMDPGTETEHFYTEQSIRLPDCWVVYDPLTEIPLRPPEQTGPIRFGSLNNPCKLNLPLLHLWGDVLKATPGSRLLLLTFDVSQRIQITNWFGEWDIDPARLEFVDRRSRPDYLRLYDRIDICLDPLPYNGITTTCDAIWMGVPVVSLIGNTPAGRAGLSLLSTIGVPELVARSPLQFVQIASDLAVDADRLTNYRRTLREQMRASPLMNAKRFAANVEAFYRKAWQKWCLSGR